ncbi:MAG TPA: osmotically inducible protein C [Blastocatellia bacterium]|nr:osmotically inducible protein C [Blastocatellia bacterium]
MSAKTISFQNRSGKSLSARLEFPIDQKPHTYAIFAHCFTCSKNLKAVRYISTALAGRGFAVLSFDFTGLGDSEGEFSDTNFSGEAEDLICAADFLKTNYEPAAMIVGHSLGGAASILAASKLDEIKAVVTVGAPAEPKHIMHLLRGGLDRIQSSGAAEIDIGGRPFLIKKQFLEDIETHDILAEMRKMRKAFLILHSPQDRTVGIENAAELYAAARHPKSFVSLDGADHLLSVKEDGLYAGDMIASWAARYVAIPREKDLLTSAHAVAYLGSEEKFTTSIKTGRHTLTADEPESVGGCDFGPSPYQLTASALAACTAMTLRMYSARKEWDMREVFVHVTHDKVHAEDCQNCESAGSKVDKFVRQIELIGDLDADMRQKLLEIANKCPVHRTLEANAVIETVLKQS